jgi:hypothetical protein
MTGNGHDAESHEESAPTPWQTEVAIRGADNHPR